ncbi:hypothetical protein HDU93_001551 [Gonapodya sp. JEL0774]|nr:hypothetical protein HDU93_001551 [Gonapodya sp. JEL0774]
MKKLIYFQPRSLDTPDLKLLYRSALLLHKSFASLPASTPPTPSSSTAHTPRHARSTSSTAAVSVTPHAHHARLPSTTAPVALLEALERDMTEAGAIIDLAELAEGEHEKERTRGHGKSTSGAERRRQVEVVRGILEEARREKGRLNGVGGSAGMVGQVQGPRESIMGNDLEEEEEDWDLEMKPADSLTLAKLPALGPSPRPTIATAAVSAGTSKTAFSTDRPPDSGKDVSAATPEEIRAMVVSHSNIVQAEAEASFDTSGTKLSTNQPPNARTMSETSVHTVRARVASTGASSEVSDWDADLGVETATTGGLAGRPRGCSVALAPAASNQNESAVDFRESHGNESDSVGEDLHGDMDTEIDADQLAAGAKLEFGAELMPVLVRRVAPLKARMSGYIREMQDLVT